MRIARAKPALEGERQSVGDYSCRLPLGACTLSVRPTAPTPQMGHFIALAPRAPRRQGDLGLSRGRRDAHLIDARDPKLDDPAIGFFGDGALVPRGIAVDRRGPHLHVEP